MTLFLRALVLSLLASLAGLSLAACRAGGGAYVEPTLETHGVILDGDVSEWPSDVAAFADEHYLYLRFTIEGEQFSLQAAPSNVTIHIDADASAATGRSEAGGPLGGMGIDAEVEFSPRRADGNAGRGVAVWRVESNGSRTRVPTEAVDFAIAPTHSSSWYEMRISRTPSVPLYPDGPGLATTGTARAVVTVRGPDGRMAAWSDPASATIEDVCAGGRRLSSLPPPAPPARGLRVISWNIELSAPMKNPEPFTRILRALHPDVLLLQEWEEGDASAVAAWLDRAGFPGWNVHKPEGDMRVGGGVLVASRFPLEGIDQTLRARSGDRETTVRVAAAVAKTPLGDLLAASLHLKCCGFKDSPEDRQRMSEARAINAMLADAASSRGARLRVVGGDVNLVGSRPPLDLLRAGLDADGSDLAIADARVLGDRTYTTWRDWSTSFPPGRLDFIVYSDSALASNSFVFDTARLTPAVLDPLGVQRDDSAASDHLPVVVDLAPTRR
jgi:endonuclease/exonuclease/phosphatase family metal-dependent hydrolase